MDITAAITTCNDSCRFPSPPLLPGRFLKSPTHPTHRLPPPPIPSSPSTGPSGFTNSSPACSPSSPISRSPTRPPATRTRSSCHRPTSSTCCLLATDTVLPACLPLTLEGNDCLSVVLPCCSECGVPMLGCAEAAVVSKEPGVCLWVLHRHGTPHTCCAPLEPVLVTLSQSQ